MVNGIINLRLQKADDSTTALNFEAFNIVLPEGVERMYSNGMQIETGFDDEDVITCTVQRSTRQIVDKHNEIYNGMGSLFKKCILTVSVNNIQDNETGKFFNITYLWDRATPKKANILNNIDQKGVISYELSFGVDKKSLSISTEEV